jgi:hypothetical protein
MKRRIDFGFGYAYSAPDRAPLRIALDGKRRPPSTLDLVPEELESLLNMHDPRLLRMQLHTQFVQNHCCPAKIFQSHAKWHLIKEICHVPCGNDLNWEERK